MVSKWRPFIRMRARQGSSTGHDPLALPPRRMTGFDASWDETGAVGSRAALDGWRRFNGEGGGQGNNFACWVTSPKGNVRPLEGERERQKERETKK